MLGSKNKLIVTARVFYFIIYHSIPRKVDKCFVKKFQVATLSTSSVLYDKIIYFKEYHLWVFKAEFSIRLKRYTVRILCNNNVKYSFRQTQDLEVVSYKMMELFSTSIENHI